MNTLRAIALFMITSVLTYGQVDTVGPITANPANRHDLNPEQFGAEVIRYLMTKPSPLKNGAVQLHRMGDHAAVYIARILQGRSLTTGEKQTALDIVRMAYEKPAVILQRSDRGNTATMALLLQLDASTDDVRLKQRIGETISLVNVTATSP